MPHTRGSRLRRFPPSENVRKRLFCSLLSQKFSLRLCGLPFINNLMTYLLILCSAKLTICSLITEPYNSLIDRFILFLLYLVKNVSRGWYIHLWYKACMRWLKCSLVHVHVLFFPLGAPGSIRVSKISWTFFPAQCKSNLFLRPTAVIPQPST